MNFKHWTMFCVAVVCLCLLTFGRTSADEPESTASGAAGDDAKKAERLDAEEVLTAGLNRARSEKKKVLIHLGAPS